MQLCFADMNKLQIIISWVTIINAYDGEITNLGSKDRYVVEEIGTPYVNKDSWHIITEVGQPNATNLIDS